LLIPLGAAVGCRVDAGGWLVQPVRPTVAATSATTSAAFAAACHERRADATCRNGLPSSLAAWRSALGTCATRTP